MSDKVKANKPQMLYLPGLKIRAGLDSLRLTNTPEVIFYVGKKNFLPITSDQALLIAGWFQQYAAWSKARSKKKTGERSENHSTRNSD